MNRRIEMGWAQIYYALFAVGVIAACILDRFFPAEAARAPAAGAIMLFGLIPPAILLFRVIVRRPFSSLWLPFLYWGWFYSFLLLSGHERLRAPSLFQALGSSVVDCIGTTLFVSPVLLALLVVSVVGAFVIGRFRHDLRAAVLAVVGMVFAHALLIVGLGQSLVLKT